MKNLKTGTKKDERFNKPAKRLKKVLVVAFGQSKLFRDFPAGLLHFFIFWGFVLLLAAIIESILQGFIPGFTFLFLGPVYSAITIVQDVFGILVVLSVIYALVRRFIVHIPRLEVDSKGKKDAAIILLLILFVIVFMYGQNISSVAIKNNNLQMFEIRPISAILSKKFYSSPVSAEKEYYVFWWAHIITVFGFLNYLPYSKHFHVISSIPNTFLANTEPDRNTIKKLDIEDENIEVYGANDIHLLSWKQLLDGYTCTECGRCTEACPASNTRKTLSPRKIIVDIRHRTEEYAPVLISKKENEELASKTLVHNYIEDKELWQCTTCMACVQECPVMIEHLDSIIDMRRYLVLTESEFPGELNNVFKSLETNFTPWAFNSEDRVKWSEGLDIKTMAEDPEHEVLFWVGCAGSFDERYKKVSVAFAKIMQKAGVKFRILGNEEKCNGDTARRLGNEYLAQMLINKNIETLNKYNVKKIVTACPHCFNSLSNEYKQFGGNYEVMHHSQFIENLIKEKRIELKSQNNESVIYHDSCYLGRYNNEYNAPRSIIKQTGYNIVEPERNKSKGFCCGAGGGRMFLEDVEGEKINVERTRELLSHDTKIISSACPFCMTMLNDGIKYFEKSDEVSVKDIAEIVLENSN